MPCHVQVSTPYRINFTLEDNFAAMISTTLWSSIVISLSFLYLTSQSFTNPDLYGVACNPL